MPCSLCMKPAPVFQCKKLVVILFSLHVHFMWHIGDYFYKFTWKSSDIFDYKIVDVGELSLCKIMDDIHYSLTISQWKMISSTLKLVNFYRSSFYTPSSIQNKNSDPLLSIAFNFLFPINSEYRCVEMIPIERYMTIYKRHPIKTSKYVVKLCSRTTICIFHMIHLCIVCHKNIVCPSKRISVTLYANHAPSGCRNFDYVWCRIAKSHAFLNKH